MSKALISEVELARAQQGVVDQDIADQQAVNKHLSQEIEKERSIKKSSDGMRKIYYLAARLISSGKFDRVISVVDNDQVLKLSISEFQHNNEKGSGYINADSVRIQVSDQNGHVTHEIILERPYDSDTFQAHYLDHTYRNIGGNERHDYKWRKSNDEGNPVFDAESASGRLPEIKEIGEILQKAVGNNSIS